MADLIQTKLHNFFAPVTGADRIGLLDTSKTSLYISAAAIAFNPIFWNIAAQTEYKNHFLTRTFGSPKLGCYFLAVTIFSLGIFRDYLYTEALSGQPYHPDFVFPTTGIVLLGIGNLLVLSSMWALGVTGTYLGDYFGILMDEPVTGFPFNVTGAPMYWGSTCSFLGTALFKGKPAGVLLSIQVFFMYLIALQFEDPFTSHIYAKRDQERAAKGKDTKKKA